MLGVHDTNELARYKRLCELFPPEIRVHTLSFRHHYEVASLKTVGGVRPLRARESRKRSRGGAIYRRTYRSSFVSVAVSC